MLGYLALSLILSAIYGFLGMALCVSLQTPADNAYRVVWGSAAFWIGVALLSWLTVGWWSAICSAVFGLVAFGLIHPGTTLFTWGRALIQFGNTGVMKSALGAPVRWLGGK